MPNELDPKSYNYSSNLQLSHMVSLTCMEEFDLESYLWSIRFLTIICKEKTDFDFRCVFLSWFFQLQVLVHSTWAVNRFELTFKLANQLKQTGEICQIILEETKTKSEFFCRRSVDKLTCLSIIFFGNVTSKFRVHMLDIGIVELGILKWVTLTVVLRVGIKSFRAMRNLKFYEFDPQ